MQENQKRKQKTYAKACRKTQQKTDLKTGKAEADSDETKAEASSYLIACEECDPKELERRKELLYEVLGPVFFGRRKAATKEELADLFQERYGIDVQSDFYEGDEHYEEYLEAQQAISEGMSIYGGAISFEDDGLAELADRVWKLFEEKDKEGFRKINTMLEE